MRKILLSLFLLGSCVNNKFYEKSKVDNRLKTIINQGTVEDLEKYVNENDGIRHDKSNILIDSILSENSEDNIVKICEFLIDLEADVDVICDDYERTALGWSVFTNKEKLCEMLLEKGARVGIEDVFGITPLEHALENEAMLKLMLRKSKKISEILVFMKREVDKGINLPVFLTEFTTPIHPIILGVYEEDLNSVKFWIEKDPSAIDVVAFNKPVGPYITELPLELSSLITEQLFSSCNNTMGRSFSEREKDNISIILANQYTPLMLAVEIGNLTMVEYLITNKANIYCKDINERTAYDIAVRRLDETTDDKKEQYKEIIKLLQKAKER